VNYNYKIVTTSWDDGHILDIKLADLLRRYQIPATLYVSPNGRQWLKKDILTSKQTIKLNNDFEIGAHTITHPDLTKISLKEAAREIRESKEYLENLLGKKVPMFCYPKGLYNEEIKKLTKRAGYLGARTIKTFRTRPPSDFFEMGTTNHSVNRSIGYSLALALANNPKFIPFSFYRDWVKVSCKTFDVVQKDGGIWHFWGHSWQIEQNNWWGKLEEVLAYVANRTGVKYLTNGETLECLK